ncbi:hypothetical protein [Mycobacterium uberis]|uniref:hypothetical protein n=1 Tax=Mycobacterium uberis TaxID=2162698 RepID=UPI001058E73C|nr:hypothetical protein [Mycobacterium uberis]
MAPISQRGTARRPSFTAGRDGPCPHPGTPYVHGWTTLVSSRRFTAHQTFRPQTHPTRNRHGLVRCCGCMDRTGGLTGHARSLSWDLSWKDTDAPLWTFPHLAREHEILPGTQVIIAPTIDFTGSLAVGNTTHCVDGWRGSGVQIYGHYNAQHWDGSMPTSVAATS